MGCSSTGMSLLQCRSPVGCSSSGVSTPWHGLPVAAVPQRCLLWHGAPPKSVPSVVLSIISSSTCLLCFVSPNASLAFLLPPFLNYAWAEVPYVSLTVWRFGIKWVLFIHYRTSCNWLWLAEDIHVLLSQRPPLVPKWCQGPIQSPGPISRGCEGKLPLRLIMSSGS